MGVMIYTALRKRQKELGIVQVGDHKNRVAEKVMKKTQPQRYRVVSSVDIHTSYNSNNSTTAYQQDEHIPDDNDLLKVYIFVPENDWDANDESNVLERLKHGDIITSINKEITSSKTTTTTTNSKVSSSSTSNNTKTTSTPSTIDP